MLFFCVNFYRNLRKMLKKVEFTFYYKKHASEVLLDGMIKGND